MRLRQLCRASLFRKSANNATSIGLRTNKFVYAPNEIDLLAVTNALGVRVTNNAYNAYHQVTNGYNALNELTVYTYDSSQRPTSVTLPTGLVTTNLYGADGFVAQHIVTGIATNSFTYSNDLRVTQTDARGLTVTNAYDALQRPTRVSFPDGTFITNTYDKLDWVKVVDRLGFTNRFEYNSLGQRVRAIDALNRTNTFEYCNCGALSSVTDPLNQVTSLFYDNAGRQLATVYPDGYAVTNRYNLLGHMTNWIDSGGASVTNWFNNQGLPATASNAFGRLESIACDVLDRATNTVDASGVTLTNTFDNLDRLLTRGFPDGGVEKFVYTPNIAGPTSYTNQLGSNVVNYAYDAAGRKTNEVYPGIATNQYTYSGANDLRTLTDGKNQTTRWGFDSFGRMTSKTNAVGTEILRFQYDPNNRFTNRWSAAKGNTAYGYDALGNLTNIDYPVSADVSFQFDALNRATNMVTAGTFTNKISYNAEDQILTDDGPWVNDTVSHTYANRLRIAMSLLQPSASAWTNGYGYDVPND